jgi:hypothetical protein
VSQELPGFFRFCGDRDVDVRRETRESPRDDRDATDDGRRAIELVQDMRDIDEGSLLRAARLAAST